MPTLHYNVPEGLLTNAVAQNLRPKASLAPAELAAPTSSARRSWRQRRRHHRAAELAPAAPAELAPAAPTSSFPYHSSKARCFAPQVVGPKDGHSLLSSPTPDPCHFPPDRNAPILRQWAVARNSCNASSARTRLGLLKNGRKTHTTQTDKSNDYLRRMNPRNTVTTATQLLKQHYCDYLRRMNPRAFVDHEAPTPAFWLIAIAEKLHHPLVGHCLFKAQKS